MDQSAVYLYDPITDYVNAELKKRSAITIIHYSVAKV